MSFNNQESNAFPMYKGETQNTKACLKSLFEPGNVLRGATAMGLALWKESLLPLHATHLQFQ
jgi:hypothetical protein